MRVGDVRKIEGFVKQGVSDEEILKHYKNHYKEDHVKVFIENAKEIYGTDAQDKKAAEKAAEEAAAKKAAEETGKGKGKGKSADPLG